MSDQNDIVFLLHKHASNGMLYDKGTRNLCTGAACCISTLRRDLDAATRRAENAEAAVKVLRDELEKIAEHKDAGYGFYHGGDPRDFHPDSESCTPEELASHKAACDAFDAADAAGTPMKPEPDGSGWVAPGVHITKSAYGIGTYQYPSHCAEMAAEALASAALDAARKGAGR